MLIQGFEKFSLVDYDGYVCVTLFLAGCNYRCPFCQNSGLVTKIDEKINISLSEIDEYLDKRKDVIDAICISGGEPTLSTDLEHLTIHFKERGLKVKIDTNGTNPAVLSKLLNANILDYVAMDIKNGYTKYSETAGVKVDVGKIKESISLLINSNIDYEFRTTLVSEFHSKSDILEIAEMIQGTKKYFLQKYVSNSNCINSNLHEVEKEEAEEFANILKLQNINVKFRGY